MSERNPALTAVLKVLETHPLLDPARVRIATHGSGNPWIEVVTEDVMLTIESRPPYCDRGRWCVKAFPKDYRFTVDNQDSFPRYYFGNEACADEVVAWLDARGQLVE